MIRLVLDAMEFAINKHHGQMRKFGGEEYIRHPQQVAALLTLYGDVTDEEVAAAWLHDVVEDCDVEIGVIQTQFGTQVAHYVWHLTNEYTKERFPNMNRKQRKYHEFVRISKLDARFLRLKLVDRLANLNDCMKYEDTDIDFIALMSGETKELLDMIEDRCMETPSLEEIYVGLCSLHSRLDAKLGIVLKN